MNKIVLAITVIVVMFIVGAGVVSPSQVADAASPAVNLLNDILALLNDPIFGLEEIKQEIIGIEQRLDAIEDQLDRIEGATCLPVIEICDGLDNDCDGIVDNGNPGGGASCSTGLQGVCAAGTTICSAGSIVCNQNVASSSEVCNGADDDCDGVSDNNSADSSCGDTFFCNGIEQCQSGMCIGGTDPCFGNFCDESTDTCNTSFSGIWILSTPPSYTCGIGGFSFNQVSISDNNPSISITIPDDPGTLTGTRTGNNFLVTNSISGTCDENYSMTGTFTSANSFTATFSASYSGFFCVDCTNQIFSITGTR